MTPRITTEHLNQALDLAARRGLSARDIDDLKLAQNGQLEAVRVLAALPSSPKKRFPILILNRATEH